MLDPLISMAPFMEIIELVLQDEDMNLHKLKKVKDTVFNPIELKTVSNWLWIYADTSEFFYFSIWEELDSAYLNKFIKYKNKLYKVIEINSFNKTRYS